MVLTLVYAPALPLVPSQKREHFPQTQPLAERRRIPIGHHIIKIY